MGHTQIGKENVRMHFNYVVSARYCISGTDIAPCGRIGDTRCSAAISESARSPWRKRIWSGERWKFYENILRCISVTGWTNTSRKCQFMSFLLGRQTRFKNVVSHRVSSTQKCAFPLLRTSVTIRYPRTQASVFRDSWVFSCSLS